MSMTADNESLKKKPWIPALTKTITGLFRKKTGAGISPGASTPGTGDVSIQFSSPDGPENSLPEIKLARYWLDYGYSYATITKK